MAITPTREQFTEFAHGTRDGEVVMINLLHFARSDADDRARRRRPGDGRRMPTGTTATRSSRWSRPAAGGSSGPVGPSTS